MTDIYFPVEKVPVKEIMPGYEHPSGISHAIVVTKPDGTKRVVQYCSNTYYLVPNNTIIPIFEKEISRFFKIEKRIRAFNWAIFSIDFLLKDKLISIMDEDLILLRITMINSYNGSRKYHFQTGFFRVICSNGMMIPAGSVNKITAMHTPKLGKETSFEAVLEMTSKFLSEASEIAEVYYELQEQPVSDWMMRIEEVAEGTKFPISLKEDVTDRMYQELLALPEAEPNDWLVYSAFNYQLNYNEEFKAKESKREEMDQDVLAYLLKY